MKLFVVKHDGFVSEGASVAIAKSPRDAEKLINKELLAENLPPLTKEQAMSIETYNLTVEQAIVVAGT